MNPFELRGPDFLLFYLALGFTVLGVVVLRRRVMEPKGPPRERLTDPLAIAYLRGGPVAAVAVGALDLLQRRALNANEEWLTTAQGAPISKPAALERAILVAAEQPTTLRSLARNPGVRAELDVLRERLVEQGLLPDSTQKVARWLSALTGLGLLAGVAASKIHTALALGKSNVGFLILMWIGFTGLLLWKASPRRTPRGERTLRDLGALLSRAAPTRRTEDAATPAYSANDLLLMAALFGLAALPGSTREAYAGALSPAAEDTASAGYGGFQGFEGGSGDGEGGGDGGGSGCGGCGSGGSS